MGGVKASKSGSNILTGTKTDAYTLEDFNKLNITETNTKPEYSDATLNKMYKENFQGPVSKMTGGNDKLALKSMTTNTSGGKVQYSGSTDGSIWVKVDGKLTKALAVTKGNAWGRSTMTFSRTAFNSTERLATTMAHELGHVTHNFLGLANLANVKWDRRYYGSEVDNYGHAAIYNMENNFTFTNGYNSQNNIDILNYNVLSSEIGLNKLSTSLDYLGKIKIKWFMKKLSIIIFVFLITLLLLYLFIYEDKKVIITYRYTKEGIEIEEYNKSNLNVFLCASPFRIYREKYNDTLYISTLRNGKKENWLGLSEIKNGSTINACPPPLNGNRVFELEKILGFDKILNEKVRLALIKKDRAFYNLYPKMAKECPLYYFIKPENKVIIRYRRMDNLEKGKYKLFFYKKGYVEDIKYSLLPEFKLLDSDEIEDRPLEFEVK